MEVEVRKGLLTQQHSTAHVSVQYMYWIGNLGEPWAMDFRVVPRQHVDTGMLGVIYCTDAYMYINAFDTSVNVTKSA